MAKKEIDKDKKNKNFGKELKSELKKVSWPTTKQLVNNTSAVISIVLIVAVIVFVLDVCFESLSDFGIGKLKSLVASEVVDDTNDEATNEEEDDQMSNENETIENEENTEPTENVAGDTESEDNSGTEDIQE